MSAYNKNNSFSLTLRKRVIITCFLLILLVSACKGNGDINGDGNDKPLLLPGRTQQDPGEESERLVRIPMIAVQQEDEDEPSAILVFSYTLKGNQRSDTLHYYSIPSQNFLWQLELPESQNVIVPRNIAAFDEEHIYLVNSSTLISIDRQSGSINWQTNLSGPISYDSHDSIRVLDGRIFVLGHDLNLQAFDTDGHSLWSKQLNHTYKNAAAIHVVNGNLAVMDLTTEEDVPSTISLKILDASDGSLIQQMVPACSDPQEFYPDVYSDVISPMKIDEETEQAYFVFNGIRWSCMQAWDTASGENIWRQETMEKINLPYFEPARTTMLTNLFMYIGTENSAGKNSCGIYRINRSDGETDCLVEDSQASFFNPLLKKSNVLIARGDYEFTSQNSFLVAFDTVSGEKLWEFPLTVKPTNMDDRSTNVFLTEEGLAVVQILDNPMAIYYDLLDIEYGGKIISQIHSELKSGHREDSNSILADGHVYFMQSNGIYTLDLADGSVNLLLGQDE